MDRCHIAMVKDDIGGEKPSTRALISCIYCKVGQPGVMWSKQGEVLMAAMTGVASRTGGKSLATCAPARCMSLVARLA
jgi:hypothetical protein